MVRLLLRDYFPKSTDLSAHSPQHLLAVENELNNRPMRAYFPDSKICSGVSRACRSRSLPTRRPAEADSFST